MLDDTVHRSLQSFQPAPTQRTALEHQHPTTQQARFPGRPSYDIDTARRMSAEAVNNGDLVSIYCRTDNSDYDDVWDEDPDPTYWAPEDLKALFTPKELEVGVDVAGPDAPNSTIVHFALHEVVAKFGERMVRVGDVIKIAYNSIGAQPGHYRVINASASGNYKFQWLYWTCHVISLRADVTVQVTRDQRLSDHGKE